MHAFGYILCHRNADEIDEPQPHDAENSVFEESLLLPATVITLPTVPGLLTGYCYSTCITLTQMFLHILNYASSYICTYISYPYWDTVGCNC